MDSSSYGKLCNNGNMIILQEGFIMHWREKKVLDNWVYDLDKGKFYFQSVILKSTDRVIKYTNTGILVCVCVSKVEYGCDGIVNIN